MLSKWTWNLPSLGRFKKGTYRWYHCLVVQKARHFVPGSCPILLLSGLPSSPHPPNAKTLLERGPQNWRIAFTSWNLHSSNRLTRVFKLWRIYIVSASYITFMSALCMLCKSEKVFKAAIFLWTRTACFKMLGMEFPESRQQPSIGPWTEEIFFT